MARLASRLIGRNSNRRTPWQGAVALLIWNRWGRLVLLGGIVAVVVYWNPPFLAETLYPTVQDQVLRAVGYGAVLIAAWAALVLGATHLRTRWLLRWWRWWLATGLLVVAAQAAMGGIHGADGIVAETTLGGLVGQALWGTSLQGIPTVGALLLLAKAVLWPRVTYKEIKGLLRILIKALLGLLHLLRRSGRWSASAVRATTRRRVRPALQTATASGEAVAKVHLQPAPADLEPADYLDPESVAGQPVTLIPQEADAEAGKIPGKPTAAKEVEVPYTGPNWRLPPTDLLEHGVAASVTEEETAQVARKIEEALSHHGVEVTVDQIKPGPTVTLYGLTPGWVRRYREVKQRDEAGNVLRDSSGKPVVSRQEEQMRVKVDSILAREKDMALALAAPSLRIQAPVPGESVVGIEVPNRDPVLVTLRSVMESPSLQDIVRKDGLALALGQGSGGDPVAAGLRKLPHLLIAGATGSGKSVCMNALIVSLVSQASPEQLRLLLIDPKRVELTPFNGLPHLVAPVVVDTEPAVKALKALLREMFRRYRRMEELGVRNIEGYHRHPKALEAMPSLVIAVDELADLMMAAPYDIEQTICRLAQLGRATGIHLIVATQRPSVDVVTGLIKANFPSRISFAVVSQVDSRTILDSAGAERLLGKGDMLFLSNETPKPQRVQGAFVSDREIERLVEFWRSQKGPPLPQFDLEPELEESQDHSWDEAERSSPKDELLDKAIELASRYSHISTSLLQRRLRIGYPRAARLMDQLEDEGIISTGEPGKSREVIRTGEHPLRG